METFSRFGDIVSFATPSAATTVFLRFGEGLKSNLFLLFFDVDSNLIFLLFFVTFECPREPKGFPKSSKNRSQMCKNDAIARNGSQGVPGYHLGLILEVFLRYFRSRLGGIFIDVGGMFVSVWEVF